MAEQVYRLSLPALVDIIAESPSEAVELGFKSLVDNGYGIGEGEVLVNYNPFKVVHEEVTPPA